jgi:hypothetical protein
MHLETGHHALDLERLEMRGQLGPNVGEQAFENCLCAVSASAV